MFDDINCDLKYSRDVQELKMKINTDYNKKSYTLLVESSEVSPKESVFLSELKWVDAFYSLKANSSLIGNGKIQVELHLDRARDMHLSVWGTAKRFSNNFGIELKWDANRDPSQKFIVSYEFDKPKENHYIGNVLISYPDRTLNVKTDFSNEGPYTGNFKLSWSADKSIDAEYSIGSDFQNHKKFWAYGKVNTPFVGWKTNKVNGSFLSVDNLLSLNVDSVFAENQLISTQLFIDYLLTDQQFFCEVKTGVQSTIKDIPIVTVFFKHNQTSETVASEVLFKHRNFVSEDFRTFSIKSSFKHTFDFNHRNVSGSIKFKSPYENYTSGAMITKFSLTKDREIFGIFDMDIDTRIYTFALEGYLRKLFDNMISFNLTSPIVGFPEIIGKFGIVELKRYLIADLKTSNRSVGVEILFDFFSITDFDLKFYIATPQPAKFLAIGKIKEDTIHLEGEWNKIKLGFRGIWRFMNNKNFEYSYMIFTPLLHFEENGLVVKLVAETFSKFDVESSFKLGKHKLGFKAFGEPRTQLISQLGLQKASYIRDEFTSDDLDDSSESIEDITVDFDLSNFFSVIGNFEICTLIVKPITGRYEIQQIDDTFHGDAKVFLQNGIIAVRNKLRMKSNYDIKNRLTVNTPFEKYRVLSSNFVLKVPKKGFTARFDVGSKETRTRNYGFKVSYILPEHQKYKIHDLKLIILYPFGNTSRFNINSRIELLDTLFHRATLDLDGFNTVFSMSGDSKVRNTN